MLHHPSNSPRGGREPFLVRSIPSMPNAESIAQQGGAIYLATPTDQYHSPHYSVVRNHILDQLQPTRLIEPAQMGLTFKAWLDAWPSLLAELDVLIAWPRADGTVGRGVYWEIRDAWQGGHPVYLVKPDRTFTGCFMMRETSGGYTRWAILQPYPEQTA